MVLSRAKLLIGAGFIILFLADHIFTDWNATRKENDRWEMQTKLAAKDAEIESLKNRSLNENSIAEYRDRIKELEDENKGLAGNNSSLSKRLRDASARMSSCADKPRIDDPGDGDGGQKRVDERIDGLDRAARACALRLTELQSQLSRQAPLIDFNKPLQK